MSARQPRRRRACAGTALFTFVLAASATGGAVRAQPVQPAPVTTIEQLMTTRARVTAIDPGRRMLTLREGELEFDVLVDERVRRFDAIRAGDVLDVRYSLGVMLSVQPASGIRERSTVEARTAPPPPGQRPIGAGMIEETIVADVLSVDRMNARLQIRGAQGRVAWLQVAPDLVQASTRVGDQLVIRYRMAVALEVTPTTP